MSRKIQVSIEIMDNYKREDFRILIKRYLQEFDDLVDLFVITEETDQEYIDKVVDALGIDTDNVIECDDIEAKLIAIEDNDIDIHLDNYERNVQRIEDETSCDAILVSQKKDNNFNLDYIVKFERALEDFDDD